MSNIYVITETHPCGDVEFIAAYAVHEDAEAFCNSTYAVSGTGCWKTDKGSYICIDDVVFNGTTDESML